MRAINFLFLLVIYTEYSICHGLGFSDTHTNFQESYKKPSYLTTKNRVRQAEYLAQPLRIKQHQERQQEFLYPNNFGNAYQYSQLKNAINQRLLSSAPIFSTSNLGPSQYGRGKLGSLSRDTSISDEFVPNYVENSPPQLNSNFDKTIPSEQKKNGSDVKQSRDDEDFKVIPVGNKLDDFDEDQEGLSLGEAEKENYVLDSDKLDFDVQRRKSVLNDYDFRSSNLNSEKHQVPVASARQQEYKESKQTDKLQSFGDVYFVAIVACLSTVAIFGVISAGYCVYKVQQSNKAAADVDYPAYGVVGPASKETNASGSLSPSGDRKLAQSAQMYHYHHQKQQMIASEKAATTRHTSASDADSDEENEEGEYTVYECPGLAPTGEMEVKNPLFHDDITPVSSPSVTTNTKEK